MYNHFAANTLKIIFFSNTFLRNNYLKIQFNYVCKHLESSSKLSNLVDENK